MPYSEKIKKILPRDLSRLFLKLKTPNIVQSYLDTIPINFELSGETNLPPHRVFTEKVAHCFEGAVFAAAALAFHGHEPLLMDFATTFGDEDHTVALFKVNKHWGAISKTNHVMLKFRDPIYKTPRELAMTYAHEYFMYDGRKSLRAFSMPFSLLKYPPEKWIVTGESLDWLMDRLAKTRYFPLAPDKNLRALRRASEIERRALEITHYRDPREKDYGQMDNG